MRPGAPVPHPGSSLTGHFVMTKSNYVMPTPWPAGHVSKSEPLVVAEQRGTRVRMWWLRSWPLTDPDSVRSSATFELAEGRLDGTSLDVDGYRLDVVYNARTGARERYCRRTSYQLRVDASRGIVTGSDGHTGFKLFPLYMVVRPETTTGAD